MMFPQVSHDKKNPTQLCSKNEGLNQGLHMYSVDVCKSIELYMVWAAQHHETRSVSSGFLKLCSACRHCLMKNC